MTGSMFFEVIFDMYQESILFRTADEEKLLDSVRDEQLGRNEAEQVVNHSSAHSDQHLKLRLFSRRGLLKDNLH